MAKFQTKTKNHLRVLVFASILCALSVILGQYASIKIGSSIRIGFGALPIVMAGCLFGPWVGLSVGLVSDLVGCAVFYGLGSLIPLVTLGAVAEGFLAGVIGKKMTAPRLIIATFAARIIGSLGIKTLGLWLYYHTPLETILFRIPIVLIESALTAALLVALFCTNSAVKKAVKGLTRS